MYSSKIIKQTDGNRAGVTEFSYRNITHAEAALPAVQSVGGFVPMGLFRGSDQSDSSGEDAGPPLIKISEEELQRRISDSFNEGLKEGKELAESGLINVFKTLRASSETIHNLRDKILRESEDELINLVMLVARKVIIQEITQDRTILAGVVQNALAGLSSREEIIVRLNPDDYLLVTAGREELLHKELLNERLTLMPDPSVSVGFCFVDTDMGTIDASLDGQMDQIYRTLLEQRSAATIIDQSQQLTSDTVHA